MVTLYLSLLLGFTIPVIHISNLEISQFYIKLDEKLVIRADRIAVVQEETADEKTQRQRPAVNVEAVVSKLPYLPRVFKTIRIRELDIRGQQAKIVYHDQFLYIDSKWATAKCAFDYHQPTKQLFLKAPVIHLKEVNTTLRADGIYNFANGQWKVNTQFEGFGIRGNVKTRSLNGEKAVFSVTTEPFASLQPLVDFMGLRDEIKVWIYPKIPAQSYILNQLSGEIGFDEQGHIHLDPKKLDGSAIAYNVKVFFQNGIPPVRADWTEITYRDSRLDFSLHHPVYEQCDINGSHVVIHDLLNNNAAIDLDIRTGCPLDHSITALLESYHVNLPFVQTAGSTRGETFLTVRLRDGHIEKFTGRYDTGEGTLLFDDTLALHVADLTVRTEGTGVRIAKCRASFQDILRASFTGAMDLSEGFGHFDLHIDTLDLPNGRNPFVTIKDIDQPLQFAFDKEVLFSLPQLQTDIRYIRGGGVRIDAKRLALFRPYLHEPLDTLKDGSIGIVNRDGRWEIEADIDWPNTWLHKDGVPVERFAVQSLTANGVTKTSINDRMLQLSLAKSRTGVKINGVDVNLSDSLFEHNRSSGGTGESDGETPYGNLEIEGTDSSIRYGSILVPAESYKIVAYPRKKFYGFFSRRQKSELKGRYVDGNLFAAGTRLDDTMMRSIMNIDALRRGTYDFNATGTPEHLEGTILMHGGVWSKGKTYNNILALLDTIPAVATLNDPGFSKEGFKIKEGAVTYHTDKHRLFLDSIYIDGMSADLMGKGYIDFELETLNLYLQIHYFQHLTNVLGKIPVAGYLLFGDDGKMAITLKAYGNLDDPQVKTEAAKDILSAPFNIIQRTITYPFKLFQ